MKSNLPSSLTFTIFLSIVMFCLVPYANRMCVTSHLSPLISHLIYMFSHANYGHYIINVWCLLCLSTVITCRRFILAYVASVLISFSPVITAPTVGFSVMLFYFYGYISLHLWRTNRFALVSLLVFVAVSFLFPWIASSLHLAMFIIGFLVWHIEGLIYRTHKFLSE